MSNQNRNLSNNLNVKRTPVGAAAIGGFFEAGLSIFGEKGLLLTEMKRDFYYLDDLIITIRSSKLRD
ncbi:MAG: hypothetical protein IPM86_13560 [Saprospiraceae bacterium]|nr:hypothetical protein [Saprospiraceae bacterium]